MSTWAEIRSDSVLVEDEAIVVLNKPAGWSVIGERHQTDLVTIAHEAGEELFPVHRIDKVTSGAVLFAKETRFHGDLTRQFNKRSVNKAYLALVRGRGLPDQGTIELPLSVGRKGRIRVAAARDRIMVDTVRNHWSVPDSQIFSEVRNYPSSTMFAKVSEYDNHTFLVVRPITGRRHQIRVHLAWIGYPIEGDPLFDKQSRSRGGRTYLHSWRLAFDAAWLGGERIAVEAAPGDEFWGPFRDYFADDTDSVLEIAGRASRRLAERNIL